MLTFAQALQPKSVEEAYQAVVKYKAAPILAGGCWTRLVRRKWPMVIDLSGLGLRYIEEAETEYRIGAMATQRDVELYEPFRTLCGGALVKAVHPILGVQFRNMATMGGSVAARFGFSDIIPALLAMKADVELFDAGRMSVEPYLVTNVRDLITAICIPKREAAVAIEALRKSASDFPYLAGSVRIDDEGYHIYIGARPNKAEKAVKAGEILKEKGLDALEEAARTASEELKFQSNSHASAEYRRRMTVGMVRRMIREAAEGRTWK